MVRPQPATPDDARSRLVVDLDVVRANFRRLRTALDGSPLHFAVKCAPEIPVLRALADQGCGFEVASAGEIRLLEDAALPTNDIVFSAPIKTPGDITYAVDAGVTRFVADSGVEVDKLAALAPRSDVFIRLSVDSQGSVMPLSQKFGTTKDDAVALAVQANAAGLRVSGLTFHVGSQAEELDVWRTAIELVGETMLDLEPHAIRIEQVDIGGGFPVPYATDVPGVDAIGATVRTALEKLPDDVSILAEPGRYLVATAGRLHTTVVGLADRSEGRWVYVNAGVYHGLAEASPGVAGLHFPVVAVLPDRTGAAVPCVIAGHSCDGTDIISHRDTLPADLRIGDTVVFGNAGAYTSSYATRFCGIDGPALDFVTGAHVPVRP